MGLKKEARWKGSDINYWPLRNRKEKSSNSNNRCDQFHKKKRLDLYNSLTFTVPKEEERVNTGNGFLKS